MGFLAGAFDVGVAGEPDDLGMIVNESPAIRGISGKRRDALGADFLRVFVPAPIIRDGLGVLARDVEGDLRGAV